MPYGHASPIVPGHRCRPTFGTRHAATVTSPAPRTAADHPAVAARAAIIPATTGKPADAERRAGVAEQGATVASRPDGSSSIEPWLALLRALLCRDGVDQMRADAELAVRP